jgi:hypothetical protein
MDPRLQVAKDRANAFWTQVCYISLQASLDKRSSAIGRLNDTTGDAQAIAERIYDVKMATANETLEALTGAAKATRDLANAGALEIYARAIEAPTAIFEDIKKAGEKILKGKLAECERLWELEKALIQEEYEVCLEETDNADAREVARLAYRAALNLADENYRLGCAAAHEDYGVIHRAGAEEFNRVVKPARDACGEATAAQNKAFAEINGPAQQARSTAANAAFHERESRRKEIDAEHQRQWELIQADYAIERRLRIAGLRTSRMLVDAYFNWQSTFAPPAVDTAE